MTAIEPFTLPFSASAWDDLRARLKRTRWPDEIPNARWANGFDLEFLRDLCRYWSEDFDWQAQLDRLSVFPHYRFQAAEEKVHFLHAKGKGPAPIPLVMTHGWPGSFLEMLEIVPLLTDPAAHGLAAEVSFDVIVPSLPGFGFSDRPQAGGTNVFRVARDMAGANVRTGISALRCLGRGFGRWREHCFRSTPQRAPHRHPPELHSRIVSTVPGAGSGDHGCRTPVLSRCRPLVRPERCLCTPAGYKAANASVCAE